MSASTLALGSASYTLLEALDGKDIAKASLRGTTETLQAINRGGLISSVGIQGDGNTTLNITDRSQFLVYNDDQRSDVSQSLNPDANAANINILANTEFSQFGLGSGNNRINAARDLVDSEIQALGGNDTVRIGGSAEGSFVSLGDGQDNFTASRATNNLDVAMGAGDDTALFLGTLTAGPGSLAQWGANEGIRSGSNIVDMGDGADSATFLGGVQAGTDGDNYEIQLGAGNDTAVFGGNSDSEGFVLNTGTGSDNVTLGRNTTNAAIDLGWNGAGAPEGDLMVLGLGATLSDSAIRSGQSRDTLRLAGTVTDTHLDLGWGGSLVEVDGLSGFGTTDATVWDLGSGNDTLTFGELSDISVLGGGSGFISLGLGADQLNLLGSGDGAYGSIEFDLGNDGESDTIVFGLDSSYYGFTISNFGTNDILFIGTGSYGYGYQFLNEFANETDLLDFQTLGNVIWSQNVDAYGTEQSIMTLGQGSLETNEKGDLTALTEGWLEINNDGSWIALDKIGEPVLDDSGEPAIEYFDPITISNPYQLSDSINWGNSDDKPMSSMDTSITLPEDNNA